MLLPILVIAGILETLAQNFGETYSKLLFDCPNVAEYFPEDARSAEIFGIENVGYDRYFQNYTLNFETKQWAPLPSSYAADRANSYTVFFSANFKRIAELDMAKCQFYWRDTDNSLYSLPRCRYWLPKVFAVGKAVYYWVYDGFTTLEFVRTVPDEQSDKYLLLFGINDDPTKSEKFVYMPDVDIMYDLNGDQCRQVDQLSQRKNKFKIQDKCDKSRGIYARSQVDVIYPLSKFAWHGRICEKDAWTDYNRHGYAYIRFKTTMAAIPTTVPSTVSSTRFSPNDMSSTVSYDTTESTEDSKELMTSFNNSTIYIISGSTLGVLSILFIIVIAIVLIYRRKKNKAKVEDDKDNHNKKAS